MIKYKDIMNRHIYAICLSMALLILNISCSEKDIDAYADDPRIFIQIPGSGSFPIRDSLIYSFPAKPAIGNQDTLWFTAAIMGPAANHDREFALKVNATGTTAVEGINYKIESKVIPANAFQVRIPVILFREGLKDKSVRLELEVMENENFKKGYERYQKAVFIWGDMFLKPDVWDKSNYLSAFGTFTQTRYEFVLRSCNITELPDPANLVMLAFYNSVVRKALLDYNAEHGTPMSDENGLVSFPIYTGVGGVG